MNYMTIGHLHTIVKLADISKARELFTEIRFS